MHLYSAWPKRYLLAPDRDTLQNPDLSISTQEVGLGEEVTVLVA